MATYKTLQRTCILSFLESNTGREFTVREIVKGIRSDSAIDYAPPESTVYRIMSDLVKSGRVRRRTNLNREYQYRISDKYSSKISVRCKICGKVQHIDGEICCKIIDELKNNSSIGNNDEIEILGVCKDCN